jgi:ankyrin repeat protein
MNGTPLPQSLSEHSTKRFDECTNTTAANNQDLDLQLLEAANVGDEEKVRTLLRLNASVCARDSDGRTGLHLAAKENHPNIVELLLEHGVDIEVRLFGDTTASYLAVRSGHELVLEV